jgi:hypothetical protein
VLRRSVVVVLATACAQPQVMAPKPRRVGEAMVELANRFERAGRAAANERWDLASYDLAEIDELIERDLDGHMFTRAPRQLLATFATVSLPELRRASSRRDGRAYELANAQAARICNDCHRASDKGFIEISESLGDVAPRIAR